MEKLKKYLLNILGVEIQTIPLKKDDLEKLPFYINNTFDFYKTTLFRKEFILLKIKNTDFQIGQIKKQFEIITNLFNDPIVLVADKVNPMNKIRLIENGIQFIIPGKQLFLPGLLIDLKEEISQNNYLKKVEKLTPSAQLILLYHFLNPNEKLEQFTFKDLAKKFSYTPMAITKAVTVLNQLELCNVNGTKEKHIFFQKDIKQLWDKATPYLISPVFKRVYIDEIPKIDLLQSNIMALPEYTDMAPGNQRFFAIEKRNFFNLQKNNGFLNLNEYDGNYCLEVWKYNPVLLAEGITQENNVDPLSLYLSLRNIQDERIEMAMDQIMKKYIW